MSDHCKGLVLATFLVGSGVISGGFLVPLFGFACECNNLFSRPASDRVSKSVARYNRDNWDFNSSAACGPTQLIRTPVVDKGTSGKGLTAEV